MDELLKKKELLKKQLNEVEFDIETLKLRREERQKIQLEISNIDRQLNQIEHSKKTGSCFKVKDSSHKYEDIDAFSIIRVIEMPRENKALCLCIGKDDGMNYDFVTYIGIAILPLWEYECSRLFADEKVIDLYTEISAEEFINIYESAKSEIQKYNICPPKSED